MSINSLNSYASPLQSTYGIRPLDSSQGTTNTQGVQNSGAAGPDNLQPPEPMRDSQAQSSVSVTISDAARETASATNQNSGELSSSLTPLTAPPQTSDRMAQETQQLQSQQNTQQQASQLRNTSSQMYGAAPASAYSGAQAMATQQQRSIDLAI